jgi:hypothetical protein
MHMTIRISEVEVIEILREFVKQNFDLTAGEIKPQLKVKLTDPIDLQFMGFDLSVLEEVSITGNDIFPNKPDRGGDQ